MANIRAKDLPNAITAFGNNDFIAADELASGETRKVNKDSIRAGLGLAIDRKTVVSVTNPTPDYVGQPGIDSIGNTYVAIALTGTMWEQVIKDYGLNTIKLSNEVRQNTLLKHITTPFITAQSMINGAVRTGNDITIPSGQTGADSYIFWRVIHTELEMSGYVGSKLRIRMVFEIPSFIENLIQVGGIHHNSVSGDIFSYYENIQYNLVSSTLLECTMDGKDAIAVNDDSTQVLIAIHPAAAAQGSDYLIHLKEITWRLLEESNPLIFNKVTTDLKTQVDTNTNELTLDKHSFDAIIIPMPKTDVYLSVSNGSELSGNVLTIPSGQSGIDSIFGIHAFFEDSGSKYYKPIADQVGKTIKVRLVFKLTNCSAITIDPSLGFYQTPSATRSNYTVENIGDLRVYTVDVVVQLVTTAIYIWISGNSDSSALQIIELMDAGFLIMEDIEDSNVQGKNTFLLQLLNYSNSFFNPAEPDTVQFPALSPVALGREFNIYTNTFREVEDSEEHKKIMYLYCATYWKDGWEWTRERLRYSRVSNGTPTDTIIRLSQQNNFGTIISDEAVTTIHDVPMNGGTGVYNLLIVGDSISDSGHIHLALMNLFHEAALAGGGNIRLFGTRENNPGTYDENPYNFDLPLYSECRSGWSTDNFLDPLGHHVGNDMDGPNPFWNASRSPSADVDFTWYLAQINALARYVSDPIDTIDMFMFTLGTNDIGQMTVSQFLTNIDSLCSKMWRDFPDCIILICTLPPRGLESEYKLQTVQWNGEMYSYYETPVESPTGDGKAFLVPITTWVNRKEGHEAYNISRVEGETTPIGGGGGIDRTHPWLVGHRQIADAQFSGIQYALEIIFP